MNNILKKIKNEVVNDKLYYLLLSIVISITTLLNWDANLMEGILPYYSTFSKFFKNGFNYNQVANQTVYTWPMWGYGLVLLLNYKLLIIIFQQILTFLVIIIVRLYLKSRIVKKAFRLSSLLILFALPWYFFQVSLWPYGISANLFTISLLFLSIGVEKSKLNYFIFSALAFGIMLNLRSDYFYLSFFISTVIIFINLFHKHTKRIPLYIFYWLSIIMITLIPWAIYSYKYSKKISFVSSNSGHVFYISLGQLPNNIWKIKPSDEDSTMRNLIDLNIGRNESTLSVKSSKLLMTKFWFLISKDPDEYIKKCLYNLKSILINPFYIGSIHLKKLNSIEYNKDKIKSLISNYDFKNALNILYDKLGLIIVIPFLAYIIGLITLYTFLFILILKSLQLKDFTVLSILILVTFFYQVALGVFAYQLPIYSTNIFLLLIIFISINCNNLFIKGHFKNNNYSN